MLIAAPTKQLAEQVISSLEEEFRLKRLGAARLVVGLEIRRDRSRRTMHITQQRYIEDVVERFGQTHAKSSVNPCEVATKLRHGEDGEGLDTSVYPYRSLIGSLLYISMDTRPDIVYIVGKLSKYCQRPTMQHGGAGITVVRYLKATPTHDLRFDCNAQLCSYSDSDWAADVDDRRSVSGIMVLYNGAPVIFKSKTQKSVAQSTAEAEYVAQSICTQETIWVRTLLEEMGVNHAGPTAIFVDNQAAISMTKQIGYSQRCKHIDLRFHYVREKVEEGVVKPIYIPMSDQLADYLTKPLASSQFRHLVSKTNVHPSPQGGIDMKASMWRNRL
ncbi:hypothetical protein PC129_g9079 [Phytophthora cactorum]|nr:hypothetical protein PC114_g11877 [Phytophthora cactorum]KAG2919437.1 hypothetical protein PC115_g10128 [Phytophthora cactorum]KAG2942468.1 hypothetical protein PC117_g9753 [Phytophthora cactorum]KAG3006338.1 hypothetical protein PC119_g15000 [Phytophthora cactorum]KAG3220159.1 hypothetical protein PC129_g9079 [Phytophthora cactorum]